MTSLLPSQGGIGAGRQESVLAVPEQPSSPLPPDQRRLPLSGLAWPQFRRARVTICFLTAVWGTGLATGSITHGPSRWLAGHVGVGLTSLGHGYWWTPLSAGLWASDLGSYLAVTVLGLLILAPAETRMGVTRTFTTFLASQTFGLLLAAGLVKLAELAHEPGTLTGATALGALPGVLGVGFSLSCTLTALWRRRLRLLLIAAATVGVMYIGHLDQVALACGAVVGLVAAAATYDRSWSWAGLHASQHEVRVLVGMLVAVPALGAIVATLIADANGPMSLSSLLFARGPALHGPAALCGHATRLATACRGPRGQQLYAPGMLVQAAPALLLMLCAYGLRRGRRLAWWLAVVINLAMLAVTIWVAFAADLHSSVRMTRVHTGARVILPPREAMLLPVVTLIVLLVTRRHFDQTAERRAARKLTATLATALGVGLGAFLLLGYLARQHSGPHPEFGVPARDLPMRFLAYMLFSNRFLPAAHLAGRLLYMLVFLLFWIVVLGALTTFFLNAGTYRDADAADRARAILMRGGSTLSYMSTWRGNKYWISSDGRSAIAYRPIAGIAVTVGEPYGDPDALDSALTEFARFCEHRSLQPCLYSVTARAREATERLGWKSVHIAEDALLPLAHLQLAGKKWQNVRNAVNKATREGITAEWCTFPEAPLELVRQVRQISGKWVADKGLPEMGFTLGGLEELNDPNIRCLIAVGADGKVHAITSWMPVYEGGRPVGWTLDLMRRNTELHTPHGVMEFLIVTAARAFQEEGARFVSLSGAPLARLDRGEQPCAVQRVLDVFANTMEPVYGFQSLLQFKDKFHPVYEPLYLAYPDPAAIGSIATAIGRAYLPDLTSRQALRLITKLRWAHISARATVQQRISA